MGARTGRRGGRRLRVTPLPRLHVITNDEILGDPHRIDLIPSLSSEGVAIHLRSRLLTGEQLYELARRIRDGSSTAWVVINDRVDVAIAAEANGVHLPKSGLPTESVRRLWGDRIAIGRSVHDSAGVATAISEGADYAMLGPIWKTSSHPARRAIGLQAIQHATAGPVIAIGGVTPDRVLACRRAGAYGVAVISAIWDAPNPASVVNEIRLLLEKAQDP